MFMCRLRVSVHILTTWMVHIPPPFWVTFSIKMAPALA